MHKCQLDRFLKVPISGEECAAMHLVSELEPRLTEGITCHE